MQKFFNQLECCDQISGVMLSGWENAVNYQYCRNLGHLQAEVLIKYQDTQSQTGYAMILRVLPTFIIFFMIVGEFSIYVTIVYHLWNHDKRSLLNKTISDNMRQERNHKNVITLSGQAFSFFLEIVMVIYCLFHMKYTKFADPSMMSILIIIANSSVSVAHFVVSHELKRYLKSEWNISIPFLS